LRLKNSNFLGSEKNLPKLVVDNPSNLVLFLSTKTIVKLSDHGIDVQPIELLLVVHRQKHLQVTKQQVDPQRDKGRWIVPLKAGIDLQRLGFLFDQITVTRM